MLALVSCLTWLALATPSPALAAEAGPHLNLKPGHVLTGRFTYEHPVQGLDQPLRSEGSFSIAPQERMIWAIEKPMATTTTITNGELVQTIGNFAVLKMTPKQMPFLSDVEDKLVRALNGDWQELEKEYILHRTGNEAAWSLTIKPRENDGNRKPFQKIIARGGRFVDSAEIYLRNAVDKVVFTDHLLK